jgi:hypothetical protein
MVETNRKQQKSRSAAYATLSADCFTHKTKRNQTNCFANNDLNAITYECLSGQSMFDNALRFHV